jgi:hypothetical protein
MSERVLILVCFEALTLFELLLPRLRRDKLTTLVMTSANGRRAGRILKRVVVTIAVLGGLAVALTPDEYLYPWTVVTVMLVPQFVGMVFVGWQMRAVQTLPVERANRNAALDLGDERTPGSAWLAPVPPFITLGLLLWLSARWSLMPVRDTLGYAPGTTAWQDPAFRAIAQLLLFGVGWSVWSGILGLVMWHGVSRRYTFRRAQLHSGVATAWSFALLWPAVVLPFWLRLPPLGLLLCAAAAATGAGLLLVFGLRARREWKSASVQPTIARLYFDRYDPSAIGDRGMNLASPWNWALFGAPTVFFFLPLLLF